MNDRNVMTHLADTRSWLSDGLTDALQLLRVNDTPAQWMCQLADRGLDRLPLPGRGQTLLRWQALAAVAAHDLSLARLFEGHADALAILAELEPNAEARLDPFDVIHSVSITTHTQRLTAQADLAGRGVWAVWAAESVLSKVTFELAHTPSQPARLKLHGTKTWCSGAACVSDALVTAWGVDGAGPQLVRVAMNQLGVEVRTGSWRAVGMGASGSVDVTFAGAFAEPVGSVGAYLTRPGFWHGGAGVAACWYGGALALGRALQRSLQQTPISQRNPYRLAALGKVDVTLQATAGLLRDLADWVDAHPHEDARIKAARVRLATESCARQVLDEAGRALGAAAYCHDAAFARAAADLPVYIRQCHGERDFAQLGSWAADELPSLWKL